jgi:FkbM family methyltransferase
MRFRSRIREWFYGSCPGVAGSFPYHGTRIYFPKGCLLFQFVCRRGGFEPENVNLLCRLASQGCTFLDVGANIGLMAAPILRMCPETRVVSFEPSPGTTKYLERTIAASPYRSRWTLVQKAVCDLDGSVEFFAGAEDMGAFDGLAHTKRGGPARRVTVPAAKLDTEWAALGKPKECVLKIDVEGAEMRVLDGALNLIRSAQPPVLLEWNLRNLQAHGVPLRTILDFAQQIGYGLHAVPGLATVSTPSQLALQMRVTESFLLWPLRLAESCVAPS